MRAFCTVLVLALVVAGVAWWQGWLTVARTDVPNNDDQVEVKVGVDREKFREDISRLDKEANETIERQATELKETVREAVETEVVEGKISSIDSASRQVVVELPEAKTLQAHLAVDAQIRAGDEPLAFDQLRVGDRVVVTYRATATGAEAEKISRR